MITSLERKLLENPSDCICFLKEFIKRILGKMRLGRGYWDFGQREYERRVLKGVSALVTYR